MRVLMVNNYHYVRGGSERVMFDEIEALRTAGHEVFSFSARHPQNAPSSLDQLFPEVPELGTLGALRRAARFPSTIANSHVAQAFRRAIEASKPNIVHFHNIYGRLTPLVVSVAAELGVPAVMTAHDYKLICPSYLRLNRGVPCSACSYGSYGPAFFRSCHKGSRVYSILYGIESTVNALKRRYDTLRAILCPSTFLLRSFAAKGLPQERLRYLPNSVRVTSHTPAKGGRALLLFAGRLSHEKGVHTLLQAMQGVSADLVIAGDGPQAAELIRAANAMQLTHVRFVGHLPLRELQSLLDACTGVVVPSEWFENAPLAVLEAFAAGRPVVGADIGGIPELITPGETGFLFSPGDPESLRDALVRLIASPARALEMGRFAQEVARTRFSPEAHVTGLTQYYREAMA